MVLSEDPHGEALFSKPLRVWTLGYDADPAEVMQGYSPLASPLNISVKLTDKGCFVTWDTPPEHGNDYLQKYIVRWYESPTGTLYGSAETTNTSYLGKYSKRIPEFQSSKTFITYRLSKQQYY